ncbi:MAG TPA: hypothetical protein VJ953_10180, partial [Saprospiraceae bacterium]|nr:hypothetical protein [Saprospiraceae bacterium]
NREVKPLSADGTTIRWESKSLPAQINTKGYPPQADGPFVISSPNPQNIAVKKNIIALPLGSH